VSAYLLDVNVMIAIIDAQHVDHRRAKGWFESTNDLHWLSCPITQNGVIRILSNPRYSASITPSKAMRSLRILLTRGRHQFVSDSMSILDPEIADPNHLLSHNQITDTYLLALAAAHNASLATFDKRLVTAAVRSEKKRVYLIP